MPRSKPEYTPKRLQKLATGNLLIYFCTQSHALEYWHGLEGHYEEGRKHIVWRKIAEHASHISALATELANRDQALANVPEPTETEG